jgi:hypothetical protein
MWKNEEYNINLILKDGIIYERSEKKEKIDGMIEDEVLIDKDPKLLNTDVVIAKFYLKK